MYMIFPILQLLLISFTLVESYEPTESESFRELKCLNDYDTELECHMISGKPINCSEYKLNVSIEKQHKCRFEHISVHSCYCKFQIQEGFFYNISFKAILWKGEKILKDQEIKTDEIKPKRPTIVSVNLTENENFWIFLDTNYEIPRQKAFVESLTIELIYRVKGSTDNTTKPLQKGQTEYELVGRNLQPNSDYVMMARVSTGYNGNNIFSDYSEPYEFSTPSSTKSLLKIIIPILCVILISFIATVFFCYIKFKKELWDIIPSPEIHIHKQTYISPLFETKFSPILIENSTLDLTENMSWRLSLQKHQSRVQVCSGQETQNKVTVNAVVNNLQTSQSYKAHENLRMTSTCVMANSKIQKDSGNSSELSFCNMFYIHLATNESSSSTQLSDSYKCENLNPKSVSNNIHNNLPSETKLDFEKESGNSCGSFIAKRSDSNGSSFLNQACPFNDSAVLFPSSKNLDLVISTDFEYRPCNGCSADSTHFAPSNSETIVVSEYQNVNELLDHRNKPEEDASIHGPST